MKWLPNFCRPRSAADCLLLLSKRKYIRMWGKLCVFFHAIPACTTTIVHSTISIRPIVQRTNTYYKREPQSVAQSALRSSSSHFSLSFWTVEGCQCERENQRNGHYIQAFIFLAKMKETSLNRARAPPNERVESRNPAGGKCPPIDRLSKTKIQSLPSSIYMYYLGNQLVQTFFWNIQS